MATYDNSKDSTIELLGITGLVCSLVCAIQQLVASTHILLTVSVFIIYGIAFTGYMLFMKMKKISILLIIISGILMLLEQAFFLAIGLILWLPFLVMIFTIIVIVMIYMQNLNIYIQHMEQENAREPWEV